MPPCASGTRSPHVLCRALLRWVTKVPAPRRRTTSPGSPVHEAPAKPSVGIRRIADRAPSRWARVGRPRTHPTRWRRERPRKYAGISFPCSPRGPHLPDGRLYPLRPRLVSSGSRLSRSLCAVNRLMNNAIYNSVYPLVEQQATRNSQLSDDLDVSAQASARRWALSG